MERSTYVLFASLALALLFVFWRPLPTVVWEVEATAARWALWALFGAGWLVVLTGTFMIDHFDLFGLRQVWTYFRGETYSHPEFQTTGYYEHVRHPLMLGFVIAFWATPEMTAGHLLFSAASTLYILVGIKLEEKDLVAFHGDTYRRYRRRTAMLIPWPGGGDGAAEGAASRPGGDRPRAPGRSGGDRRAESA